MLSSMRLSFRFRVSTNETVPFDGFKATSVRTLATISMYPEENEIGWHGTTSRAAAGVAAAAAAAAVRLAIGQLLFDSQRWAKPASKTPRFR